MRISPEQTRIIVEATRDLAGPGAHVRLFGLRLRDNVKGGDIDLLVELPVPLDRPVWPAARITERLQRLLGDRKIDVLVLAHARRGSRCTRWRWPKVCGCRDGT